MRSSRRVSRVAAEGLSATISRCRTAGLDERVGHDRSASARRQWPHGWPLATKVRVKGALSELVHSGAFSGGWT